LATWYQFCYQVWADLVAMREAGTLEVPAVAGVLATFLSGDDERLARLLSL
jgi:hypothetical protein